MEKINFLELFKKAWAITWHHKYLWWLGLFAGPGAGLSLNFPANLQKEAGENTWNEQASVFLENHFALFWGLIFVLIFLFIALEIIRILAFSGLIRNLIGVGKGEAKKTMPSVLEGKMFFSRILGIRALVAFLVLALILVLAVPIVFLFSIKSFWLGGITALMAFVILIPALIIFSFIAQYGSFYVLAANLSLKDSLEQGYRLFAKNSRSSIIMSLLFIPLNILIGIMMLVPIIFLGILSVILGLIFYQLFSVLGIWIVGSVAGVLFLAMLLFIRSISSVFYHSVWLLFFQEIATAKKEAVEIKEELVIESEIRPEEA